MTQQTRYPALSGPDGRGEPAQQGGASDHERHAAVLGGGAAHLTAPQQERCGCGAPAEVRDLEQEHLWCTDCWVADRCLREEEQEAALVSRQPSLASDHREAT